MDEPSNPIPDLGTGTLAPKRVDSTLEPLAPEGGGSGTTKPRFNTALSSDSLPKASTPWENIPSNGPIATVNNSTEPVSAPPPKVNPSTATPVQPSTIANPAPPIVVPQQAQTARPVVPPLPPKLASSVPEVFYVPPTNAPVAQEVIPPSTNPPAASYPSSGTTANIPPAPPIQNPPPARNDKRKSFLPGFRSKVFLAAIIVFLLVGAAAAASVKIFVLDRLTTLDLLPDDTRFYLSIAVKDNPEAKALKDLVKKFPSGEKVIESFDKQLTKGLSSSDNPFSAFLQLDKNDLFLTQISQPKTDGDYDPLAYANLISISNLLSPSKATEELNKIENDSKNVVKKTKYGEKEILELSPKGTKTSALPLYCNKPGNPYVGVSNSCDSSINKTPSIFATTIKQFIAAGPKEEDIKKISDLERIKASFGLQNDKKLKSLKSNPDYQAISKELPDKAFLKYYSNLPVSPYNSFLPATSLQQSFFGVSPYSLTSPDPDSSRDAKTLTNAISVTTSSSEFQIDSYELDKSKSKNSDLKNPFSLNQSLANQIPTTLNGVVPAFYAETRNIRAQLDDQFEQLRDLSKNSDSKKQRDAFAEALKSWEESKKTYKESINLDFDTEVLPLFEGQSSIIFNAGAAKTAPELLILTEIKDKEKAEASLKKISIPDYSTMTYDYETGYTPPTTKISPQPIDYSGTNIYSLPIYTYSNVKISIYFAVTDKKVILAVSTTDQSIKELIDFEAKPAATLLKTSKWQAQFGSVKDKIGGFAYIEPIQFWGFYEYIKSTLPEYTASYATSDMETAAKAYLETLQSIATVVTKKKLIYRTTTAVRIVELSASKKKAAEKAVDRLLKGYDEQGVEGVLGISTANINEVLGNFFH